MSPRRRTADKWPRPEDSTLERARYVAGSYRTALMRVAPEECARLDANAERVGQGWVVPKPVTVDLDDELDTEQVAAFCYVQPRTIDAWVADGLRYRRDGSVRKFVLRDVLDYDAERRRRRAGARQAG